MSLFCGLLYRLGKLVTYDVLFEVLEISIEFFLDSNPDGIEFWYFNTMLPAEEIDNSSSFFFARLLSFKVYWLNFYIFKICQ